MPGLIDSKQSPAGAAQRLFERERERVAIASGLEAARRGRGGAVILEGPAGSGKSSLLADTRLRAADRGFQVFTAVSAEVEMTVPFAVVRHLFGQLVQQADAGRRRSLLDGPAGAALPALGGATGVSASRVPEILHGLLWLLINISAAGPVALLIDDAHWADSSSARWIDLVNGHLAELPVALLVTVRPRQRHPFGAHACSGPVLQLPPLSVRAIEVVIESELGAPPDAEFVTACRRATAGNPFAVTELLRECARKGLVPSLDSAKTVSQLTPPTLAQTILARLARLEGSAIRLAQAIAVLGDGCDLHAAGEAAGMTNAEARTAADTLTFADILAYERPVRFVHPLVCSSIYSAIPLGERSAAHTRAARALEGRHAAVDAIARQLLLTDPGGDPWIVEALLGAAADSLERGAPAVAATQLRRALVEPPTVERRPTVLHRLGLAELASRDPAACSHLEAALDATDDTVGRALIAQSLADALLYAGDWEQSMRLVRTTAESLGSRAPELSLQLEAWWAGLAGTHAAARDLFEQDRERLLALSHGEGNPGALAIHLALLDVLDLRDLRGAREVLADKRSLGRVVAELGAEALAVMQAGYALVYLDELEAATDLAEVMLANARTRGSVLAFVAASAHSGHVALRRGSLDEALTHLQHGWELAANHGLQFAQAFLLAYGARAYLLRGDAPAAARLLGEVPESELLRDAPPGATALDARAHVRRRSGDLPGAISDLRALGDYCERTRTRNPNVFGWRSALAMCLGDTDPEQALALAEAELTDARRAGSNRAQGIALRALSHFAGAADRREALLVESVQILELSPHRLELAATLLELGIALRGRRRPRDAREPLRRALDLADRCGASTLAARAREEALIAGARPRRNALRGIRALTPSELRVARLAATGLSNREIGSSLFITPKTVGDHLSAAYRKLEINGRQELVGLLGDEPVR